MLKPVIGSEDNYWVADLVENSDVIKAFIANLDPRDPHFRNQLDSLMHYKKFRGIRIRTKTKIDLSDPKIIKALGELEKRRLILELRGYDPGIIKIAREYPKMSIIMNHLIGIHLDQGIVIPTNWKEYLTALAAEPNIYCKISALYTISGQNPAPTSPTFYKPLIDPVIDLFGSKRVMFGSNWTLSDLRGSYSDMIKLLDAYLEERTDLKPEQFYFYNALKAYGI